GRADGIGKLAGRRAAAGREGGGRADGIGQPAMRRTAGRAAGERTASGNWQWRGKRSRGGIWDCWGGATARRASTL
ncbi:MAG: hypothetical protein LBE08_05990, partial [Bifidobacteriaceae bacterium]|nr:hypothetical protein [Bifidobacteriaceae bacterium]